MTVTDIIDVQIDAYNRGDTEAFAATYAADALDSPHSFRQRHGGESCRDRSGLGRDVRTLTADLCHPQPHRAG